MTTLDQNPFAPPRVDVRDHVETSTELVEATRLSRFFAFLIDCAPWFVGGIVAAVGMGAGAYGATRGGGGLAGLAGMAATFGFSVLLIISAALGWLVYNAMLVYRYGQIFGKRVMNIRVVRTDGSRVSFPRFLFLRGLPMAIVGYVVGKIAGAGHPFAANLVTIVDAALILGPQKRCIHDYIADTMVVTADSSEHATLAGSRGEILPTIEL